MAEAFKILKDCPVCGCEILIEVLPVDEHPEIGAGHDLEVQGTICTNCASIIGGSAEIELDIEAWCEADG